MENREIKFKVWDNWNKKFLDYGEVDIWDLVFTEPKLMEEIYTDGMANECLEFLQYTGLEDKNGVRIYEGDILNFNIQDHNGNDNIYTLPVEYYVDTFMCFDKDTDAYFSIGEIKANDEELEVIGNICENKELLYKLILKDNKE